MANNIVTQLASPKVLDLNGNVQGKEQNWKLGPEFIVTDAPAQQALTLRINPQYLSSSITSGTLAAATVLTYGDQTSYYPNSRRIENSPGITFAYPSSNELSIGVDTNTIATVAYVDTQVNNLFLSGAQQIHVQQLTASQAYVAGAVTASWGFAGSSGTFQNCSALSSSFGQSLVQSLTASVMQVYGDQQFDGETVCLSLFTGFSDMHLSGSAKISGSLQTTGSISTKAGVSALGVTGSKGISIGYETAVPSASLNNCLDLHNVSTQGSLQNTLQIADGSGKLWTPGMMPTRFVWGQPLDGFNTASMLDAITLPAYGMYAGNCRVQLFDSASIDQPFASYDSRIAACYHPLSGTIVSNINTVSAKSSKFGNLTFNGLGNKIQVSGTYNSSDQTAFAQVYWTLQQYEIPIMPPP